MKPDVVVDVGNSRMKWGLCREGRVAEFLALPLNDPQLWAAQFSEWELSANSRWVASGVNPRGLERLMQWLEGRTAGVSILSSCRQVPLTVRVDVPENVGIDRLLNAVAATEQTQSKTSSFIVDAGSAVTVDWVDESGAFRGGAILPGLRLMAKALRDYTALLPVIDVSRLSNPPMPGTSTKGAIEAGIFWTTAAGVKELLRQLTAHAPAHSQSKVYLTGGDAHLLEPVLEGGFNAWPEMTLEGIRLSAEKLP